MKSIKKDWNQYFTESLAGLTGSFVLGILGFLFGLAYGSNNACVVLIYALFNSETYELCGYLGTITGMIIGAILGIILLRKFSKNRNLAKWICLAIIILFPPTLVLSLHVVDMNLLGTVQISLVFILCSLIPSIIITFLMNWKMVFKSKR